MMKALFLLLFIFPASVFATNVTSLELKQAVAFDLQLLMDDTVNEGQNFAQVIYQGEIPIVSCRISPMKFAVDRNWAYCYVDFHVVSEEGSETNRTCAVLYHYSPTDVFAELKRGGEQTFLRCMEDLDAIIE